MQISISKIVILQQDGCTDKLYLYTNYPEGTWPYTDKLRLKAEVSEDSGEEYCNEYFPGVPIEFVS